MYTIDITIDFIMTFPSQSNCIVHVYFQSLFLGILQRFRSGIGSGFEVLTAHPHPRWGGSIPRDFALTCHAVLWLLSHRDCSYPALYSRLSGSRSSEEFLGMIGSTRLLLNQNADIKQPNAKPYSKMETKIM